MARILDVSLTGVLRCMKYEIGQMLRRGGGAIVNTGSGLGLVGNVERSFRVNAVCPSVIQTVMTAARLDAPEQRARMIADEPIGRCGEPTEIAAAVVLLCSDAASFVTGTAMPELAAGLRASSADARCSRRWPDASS